MNDRYLYKAKRIDNGEWVEGDLVHSVYKINDTCVGKYGSEVGIHQVHENTICQCTGLKDKNGKLIWESDVVRKVDTNALGYHRERICTVSYEKSGYWNIITTLGDGYWIGEFEKEQLEVIGNKFDNPELLEVEE